MKTDTPRTDACGFCGEKDCKPYYRPHGQECRSALCEMTERAKKAEAEVARLRDEAQSWKKHSFTLRDEVAWFSERLNRAIEIGKTLSFSHCYDCQKDNCSLCNLVEELARLATAPEEPAPQWRELGPDETIQEGDEVLSSKGWRPAIRIGRTKLQVMSYRTRRPLELMKTSRQLEQELNASEAEVERLKELMSRLCESVAENWDEGIAKYFKDEMNKSKK